MWALYSPPGSTSAFEVTGGEEAFALLDNFQIMKLAVSLGGAETLISHLASITHSGVARELREEIGLTDALIRISVGIENVEDLISEIAQGLERVTRRQKPSARKPLALVRVTNVSVAAMQVTTSGNLTSPRAVMSPSAVSGSLKSACFDRAVAVEGSLETRVHLRWGRGEPCAPKVVFAPACWGHGSSAVRGGHIQQTCGRR